MSFKNFWRNYFYFNRKERSGIQFLLIACIVLTLGLLFLPVLLRRKPFDYSSYENEIAKLHEAQLRAKDSVAFQRKPYEKNTYTFDKKSTQQEGALFPFDPNSLSTEGWQKLGLSEKQASVITRYTAKGGKFYKKEDLKKMVVISDAFYERISPYVVIEKDIKLEHNKIMDEKEEKKIRLISINEADSVQLLEVNGIGEKLASRIIKYRDRLGGFYSLTQLKEIYGLSEDNFVRMQAQLTIQPNQITQININYCGLNELASHPYLGKAKANKIIQYRNKNGTFKKVENVLELELLDSATFEKVKHYFVVQ